MTFEQIQYFVISVEAGSFSEAAKRLYVSHSTVSRSVAALEEELDTALLSRGRQGLSLTAGGERFFRGGQELLRFSVALKDEIAKFRTLKRLKMMSVNAYMPRVYKLLREFREKRPDIELAMEQADQTTVVERLRRGETDIGIGFSYSWPQDEDLGCLVVETGRFCALVSPDHPFSSREFLTKEELISCPELLGENPFGGGQRRGDSLDDIPSIIWQIKAGRGVTVLPEHGAAEFGQGCVQIPIKGDVTRYQLLLVWRKQNTSAALKEAVAFFSGELEK